MKTLVAQMIKENLSEISEAVSQGLKPKNISFELFSDAMAKKEGIVLLGAGGNPQEWIDGVSEMLAAEGISKADKGLWASAHTLKTTGGRTDLALVFKKSGNPLDIRKMAIWRLNFGDCSWISDYIDNYKDQHIEESEARDVTWAAKVKSVK